MEYIKNLCSVNNHLPVYKNEKIGREYHQTIIRIIGLVGFLSVATSVYGFFGNYFFYN